MLKDIKMIVGALDLLHTACENINYYEACSSCSLKEHCLENTSPLDIAEEVTEQQFTEFLGLADDVQDFMDETDWQAYYADQARKIKAEEEMIYMS